MEQEETDMATLLCVQTAIREKRGVKHEEVRATATMFRKGTTLTFTASTTS